jgi:predicted DNA-binding transcriptional regulator YafY
VRASRLLSIVLLLQVRGRLTARELADRLEVSVRTVYRDIESLSAAGIPLYGEAGHDGGYQLLDGYRTRLTGLTGDEAEALFLTGLPGAAADLGLGAVLATARLKLMAAIPEELRDGADRIQQRFHLDTSGWYAEPDAVPHLAAVVDATWHQRRIRVGYQRWQRPRRTTRVLDPYGLVLKSGHWYLVAGTDGAVRTYRVAQLERVQPLAERFERPAAFDLASHWADFLDGFDRRRHRGEALVRLSPQLLDHLPHLLEPALARAARDTARPDGPDGWVTVRLPLESVAYTAGLLLRLGDEAEVLDPPELRDHLAGIVTRLAATYAPSGVVPGTGRRRGRGHGPPWGAARTRSAVEALRETGD